MPYFEGLQIDAISDTHNKHKHFTLRGGDILIHAGDATSRGRPEEIQRFLDWFGDQDYAHRIFVPGNHDWGFEKDWLLYKQMCEDRGIHVLYDSGVEIEGIKVWGSPVQPWFWDWAFNRHRGQDIKRHWDEIPNDTEILVTHGPPHGILDYIPTPGGGFQHVGCEELTRKIAETQIKLHVFGHIHYAAGYKYLEGRTYVNASALSESYSPTKGNPKRIVKQVDDYFVEDDMADPE
jgi:Icc-related predicted phosphoesterase